MTMRGWIVWAVVVAPVVALVAAYIGVIADGNAAMPDFNATFDAVGKGTATAAQIVFALAVVIVVILAALAPIIYAIRANDLFTVLVSLAMTGGAILMLMSSRTVIDQISALVLYLANITLSAIVYAAHGWRRGSGPIS